MLKAFSDTLVMYLNRVGDANHSMVSMVDVLVISLCPFSFEGESPRKLKKYLNACMFS